MVFNPSDNPDWCDCLGKSLDKAGCDKIREMPMNQNRVLLFDVDGTLLDPMGEGHTCIRLALEEVFGTAGPIGDYDMAGKTDWQIITGLMRLAGVPGEVIEERLRDAFAAYAQHVACTAPTFKLTPLPGVPALLNRLAESNGHSLGLLTGNVREAVPYKLKAAGINPDIFQFGAFGSEHIDRNTLATLALARLEELLGSQVPPESALIIGDTPRDIACARSAGMKVLSVATGHYDHEVLAAHQPDFLLDDLADTDAVMAILSEF